MKLITINPGAHCSNEDYTHLQIKSAIQSRHGHMFYLGQRIAITCCMDPSLFFLYSADGKRKLVLLKGATLRNELDRIRQYLLQVLAYNPFAIGQFKETDRGEFIRISEGVVNSLDPKEVGPDYIPKHRALVVTAEVYAVFAGKDGLFLQTEITSFCLADNIKAIPLPQ